MFRLLLVTWEIQEGRRLLFGEAVEDLSARSVPPRWRSVLVKNEEISLLQGIISSDELGSIFAGKEDKPIVIAGKEIKTGNRIRRIEVLLGPANFTDIDRGTTLHPDQRFTYRLEEWWARDHDTVRDLCATRAYEEIGEVVKRETGLALNHLADRIGNFLIFRRLSNWVLDSAPSFDKATRWVRPLYVGASVPTINLILAYRVLSGQESIKEGISNIDRAGINIPIQANYSHVTFSLFDRDSGDLLAYETSDLLTGFRIEYLDTITAPIKPVGSDGQARVIQWKRPESRRSTRDRLEPWMNAGYVRSRTNALLRERFRVHLFNAGSRKDVVKVIRAIVRDESKDFLYIWDPYFNHNDAKDFLPELPPGLRCRILCGNCSSKSNGKKREDLLHKELNALRSPPLKKLVECKFRRRQERNKEVSYYHDRFLITGQAAWILGSSLNSIGKKDGCLVRLLDPDRIRWMFEDEWDAKPASENFTEENL